MSSPAQDIYTALWTILEDSSTFTNLVKSGNRYKFHSTVPTDIDSATYGDSPRVIILPRRTKIWPFSDTANTGVNYEWSIMTASGNQSLTTIFDVHWAVLKAMSNWSTRLKALTLSGNSYVRSCRALEVVHDLDNRELNKGTRGWSEVWAGEVQCMFLTSSLQA